MKNRANRILIGAMTLILLLGVLPLAVTAEEAWDGSEKTIILNPNETIAYVYTPADNGYYTIHKETSAMHVSFEPVDWSIPDVEPRPNDGQNYGHDVCYWLKGGTDYYVNIKCNHSETLTDTMTIHPGQPKNPQDSYPLFPADGKLSVAVNAGEEQNYRFIPTQSGRYVLYSGESAAAMRLRGNGGDLDTPDHQLAVANPFGIANGYYADLTAGETYVVTLRGQEQNAKTCTYYFEKAEKLSAANAELRASDDHTVTNLFGYVGGTIRLFPYTQPLYYQAFTTGWHTDNETILRPQAGQGTGLGCEFILLNAGTTTVSAFVDGETIRATIQVKERPQLTLNETTEIPFGGSVDVECTFTPAESGTYQFAVSGGEGTCGIKDTSYYKFIEQSGTLSAYLTAGKTYIFEGAFGPKTYTIRVTQSSGTTPTNPAPPSGDEPTDPTEAPATKPTTSQPTNQKVPVHKENGKAMVNYDEVAHLLNPDSDETITVAVDDPTITAVSLPTDLLAKAAENSKVLQVTLPHATVVLDTAVLAKAAQAAKGDAVELTVTQQEITALTDQQQNQLKNKTVAAVISLSLNGGEEIHELGGMAAVTIPVTPAEGHALTDYVVYYLTADGKLEKMKTTADNGSLTFLTQHFSDYTVVYEPATTTATQAPSQTTPSTEEDTAFPFAIGKVVLFSILALLIMVGGGVAIYIITKHQSNQQK